MWTFLISNYGWSESKNKGRRLKLPAAAGGKKHTSNHPWDDFLPLDEAGQIPKNHNIWGKAIWHNSLAQEAWQLSRKNNNTPIVEIQLLDRGVCMQSMFPFPPGTSLPWLTDLCGDCQVGEELEPAKPAKKCLGYICTATGRLLVLLLRCSQAIFRGNFLLRSTW